MEELTDKLQKAKDAGAEIFVAGSYLFCQNSVEQQIAELKGILQ